MQTMGHTGRNYKPHFGCFCNPAFPAASFPPFEVLHLFLPRFFIIIFL
jgi:hypothetical protein